MDQLKAQADALGPLLPKRNIFLELGVEVSDFLRGMSHPNALQVFWDAVLSEPSQTETAKSVKADPFDLVQDAKDVSLLQGSALR